MKPPRRVCAAVALVMSLVGGAPPRPAAARAAAALPFLPAIAADARGWPLSSGGAAGRQSFEVDFDGRSATLGGMRTQRPLFRERITVAPVFAFRARHTLQIDLGPPHVSRQVLAEIDPSGAGRAGWLASLAQLAHPDSLVQSVAALFDVGAPVAARGAAARYDLAIPRGAVRLARIDVTWSWRGLRKVLGFPGPASVPTPTPNLTARPTSSAGKTFTPSIQTLQPPPPKGKPTEPPGEPPTGSVSTATPPPGDQATLDVSPPDGQDFGLVVVDVESPARELSITNTSRFTVKIGSVQAAISGSFLRHGTCRPAKLAPGASCTIAFSFKPTRAGVFRTGLTIGVYLLDPKSGQEFESQHPKVPGFQLSGTGLDLTGTWKVMVAGRPGSSTVTMSQQWRTTNVSLNNGHFVYRGKITGEKLNLLDLSVTPTVAEIAPPFDPAVAEKLVRLGLVLHVKGTISDDARTIQAQVDVVKGGGTGPDINDITLTDVVETLTATLTRTCANGASCAG